jgi:hypothetical protein
MRLYRSRVEDIAKKVIKDLTEEEHIEVLPANQLEAVADLEAVMVEYLKREHRLRDAVREQMVALRIPYSDYGTTRSRIAREWGHPMGSQVERYLATQFVESFMVSPYIEEVFSTDSAMKRIIQETLVEFNVDEGELRDEAREKIKNIPENSSEYEIRLEQALREVRIRHGLIIEKNNRR